MNQIKISKIEAAKKQLITAIILFFEDGDEISIYTLTRAANQILDDLCRCKKLKRGILNEGIKKYIKPEHRTQVFNQVNKAKNFFKHADKDSLDILTWDPRLSLPFIWDSISLLGKLQKEKIEIEFFLFCAWYRIQSPDLWEPNQELDRMLMSLKDDLDDIGKNNFYKLGKQIIQAGTIDLGDFQIGGYRI